MSKKNKILGSAGLPYRPAGRGPTGHGAGVRVCGRPQPVPPGSPEQRMQPGSNAVQGLAVRRAAGFARGCRFIGAALAAAIVCVALPTCSRAADIYGTITCHGTPPPEVPIAPLKNDPICGPHYKEMPTTHFYKVDAQGGFGDVVVSLAGIHGKSTGPKAAPLVIDQKDCEYVPYVSACQTGQKILVKNSDPTPHSVHTTPEKRGNQSTIAMQMANGPDVELSFDVPENFLRFKCDVHVWMFAYVSVFDHPWFSVSGKDGHYRIHDVPAGQYSVVAMHRKAGTLKKTVKVKDQDVKLDFVFETKPQT